MTYKQELPHFDVTCKDAKRQRWDSPCEVHDQQIQRDLVGYVVFCILVFGVGLLEDQLAVLQAAESVGHQAELRDVRYYAALLCPNVRGKLRENQLELLFLIDRLIRDFLILLKQVFLLLLMILA